MLNNKRKCVIHEINIDKYTQREKLLIGPSEFSISHSATYPRSLRRKEFCHLGGKILFLCYCAYGNNQGVHCGSFRQKQMIPEALG